MSWFSVLLTLPLPLLAAVLYTRIKRKPEESFHLMRLNSLDVKIAFQLFGFGFVSLLMLVISRKIGAQTRSVAMVTGTTVTLTISVALVILNVAVRPPGRFHEYLPGRRLRSN